MAYERKKPQILLLDRWEKTILEDLTDEEAGRILKAMYKYFNHGDEPAFQDRLLRFFWEDIEKWLNDNRTWYQGICDANAKAGKASGESRRKKREQALTPVNTSEQALTPVNTSERKSTQVNIDKDKANDKANDKAYNLMPNDKANAQCAMPNDKHSASDNDNHPSNIQTTSIITEGAGKNAAAQQPSAADNVQETALKDGAASLDGRTEEALKVNPGNFKKYYQRAGTLAMETIFKLCDMRRDMIRQGAAPAEVDRGIQMEIDKQK